ncbi:hypothetical protein PanWU01x14_040960 [Parasponia andersonii]|uniref:Uncharacterized protein n=1 Tax=Parasponia andersonii TaxID=3476 RepID=A0A2P5DQC1_PARAD|nr:hypothetical protein PanWU01x14_040960 [Parasponia andersonii]
MKKREKTKIWVLFLWRKSYKKTTEKRQGSEAAASMAACLAREDKFLGQPMASLEHVSVDIKGGGGGGKVLCDLLRIVCLNKQETYKKRETRKYNKGNLQEESGEEFEAMTDRWGSGVHSLVFTLPFGHFTLPTTKPNYPNPNS